MCTVWIAQRSPQEVVYDRNVRLSAEQAVGFTGKTETRHNGLTLHTVLSGNGNVYVEGRRHPLCSDGYLLVQSRSIQHVSLRDAHYVRILIPESLVGGRTFSEALTPHDYHVDVAISVLVSRASVDRAQVLLEALDAAKELNSWGFFLDSAVDTPLLHARERMLAGLALGDNLATVSSHAGYSPFHFQRLFSRAHGMSPASYLAQERVRKACRELILRDDPFEQIAWRCGFRSASSFAGLFKRLIGHTPSAFRQRGLQFRDAMGFYIS